MTVRYKSSWWNNGNGVGTEYYESDATPIPFNDCLIYERKEYGYPVFDVVLNGVAVTQRAGLDGAKEAAAARRWEKNTR